MARRAAARNSRARKRMIIRAPKRRPAPPRHPAPKRTPRPDAHRALLKARAAAKAAKLEAAGANTGRDAP